MTDVATLKLMRVLTSTFINPKSDDTPFFFFFFFACNSYKSCQQQLPKKCAEPVLALQRVLETVDIVIKVVFIS